VLRFEPLEDRALLDGGTLHGVVTSPNVGIPDNGGNVNMAVALSGAPADAVISGVSVHYTVAHPNVGDLQVWLTAFYGGAWHDHLWLWDRAGGGQDNIDETESGLNTWDGASPNQAWYLVARDEAAGATGYLDSFEIWVDYDVPEPLPAITEGRLAYHSYTDYGVDGELHVWDFASNAADSRAEQTVNARVQYAMNPQLSGNGRYLVLMGVDRQLAKAWPNLDVFIYDFRNDTVTNLSESLVSTGFLTAGADWIDEDPSFDPTSLSIAFKRRSGGSSDLWSMKLDGTATTPIALTRLTNTPSVEESGPKFSPDGETIVCWVGGGASSWIGSLPAAGGAVTLVVDNADKQDYYPSYWQAGRIIYTSWDTDGGGDDDIRVRDLASRTDAFGLGGFHSAAEDSDAFAISPTLVGFSTVNGSADNTWRLWYGDPTTGAVQAFPFKTADKHDLGGSYTSHFVNYVPGPERSELPGDYNFNYVVDAADYSVWRDTLGSTVDLRADGSGAVVGVPDGVVDQLDYDFWKAHFGNVLGAGGGALAEPVAAVASVLASQPPALPGVGLELRYEMFGADRSDIAENPPAEPGADGRVVTAATSDAQRVEALLAWLTARTAPKSRDDGAILFAIDDATGDVGEVCTVFDRVFDLLGSEG